eukprot:3238042-Lingulodinium_polyedra.AAC.1
MAALTHGGARRQDLDHVGVPQALQDLDLLLRGACVAGHVLQRVPLPGVSGYAAHDSSVCS